MSYLYLISQSYNVPAVSPSFLVDRNIIVKDFEENCVTTNGDGRMYILVTENGRDCKFCTNNPQLKQTLIKVREMNALPFEATLRKQNLAGNKIEYYFE